MVTSHPEYELLGELQPKVLNMPRMMDGCQDFSIWRFKDLVDRVASPTSASCLRLSDFKEHKKEPSQIYTGCSKSNSTMNKKLLLQCLLESAVLYVTLKILK